MRRTSLAFVAVVALIAASGASARADGASDAKDLFERGRALRASNDCAGAVPLFRKAYEVFPSGLGSLRNLAECEEALSHWASARRAWLDLKRGLVVQTDKKYDGWQNDAEAAAARLAPKVAHVTIHLVHDPGVDTDVTINEEPVAPALIDTALERDPGSYVVRARTPDGPATERKLSVAAGESQDVELRVIAPTKEAPKVHATPEPHAAHTSPNAVVGWVGVSFGVAALIGGAISLGVRQSAMDSLNAQCPSYTSCDRSLDPTVSRGKLASALVDGLGIGGAVVLGIGIVLVVTSPKEPNKVTVSFDGRRLDARWTF